MDSKLKPRNYPAIHPRSTKIVLCIASTIFALGVLVSGSCYITQVAQVGKPSYSKHRERCSRFEHGCSNLMTDTLFAIQNACEAQIKIVSYTGIALGSSVYQILIAVLLFGIRKKPWWSGCWIYLHLFMFILGIILLCLLTFDLEYPKDEAYLDLKDPMPFYPLPPKGQSNYEYWTSIFNGLFIADLLFCLLTSIVIGVRKIFFHCQDFQNEQKVSSVEDTDEFWQYVNAEKYSTDQNDNYNENYYEHEHEEENETETDYDKGEGDFYGEKSEEEIPLKK